MKRICFIMHRFAGGGAEKVTILLANQLVKLGYDITFFVKSNDGELKKELSADINVIELSQNKFEFFRNLYRKLKIMSFDTVFGVSMGMSTYGIIINKILGNKLNLFPIIHCAMSKTREPFIKIKCLLFYILKSYFNKAIIISEAAREDFLKITNLPNSKVVTIYNPVVSDEIRKKSLEINDHEWIIKHDIPIIVTAGRLTLQKNHKLLLDCIAEIIKEQSVRCIILGQGELEKELKEYAIQLNIDKYVDFYGFTSNPYSFFENADCFVLSSSWEGLPTVLIEALACGCPVVSTDCVSGPKEILDSGKYGKLVPEDDAIALSDAIKQTLNESIDENILIERSSFFSVERAVQNYIDVIEGQCHAS